MPGVIERNHVFVKELVGYFKAANAYELFDESGRKIGEVKEEVPGFFRKLLKFTDFKTMLPFLVHFHDEDGAVYLSLKRKFSVFRSKVDVIDPNGHRLGWFKQKVFSLGGRFFIMSDEDRQLGEVKGDWKGWDFKVLDADGRQVGQITKKWAGIGKELFTSADNYVITVDEGLARTHPLRPLIFAAGICIDMVLKEQGR